MLGGALFSTVSAISGSIYIAVARPPLSCGPAPSHSFPHRPAASPTRHFYRGGTSSTAQLGGGPKQKDRVNPDQVDRRRLRAACRAPQRGHDVPEGPIPPLEQQPHRDRDHAARASGTARLDPAVRPVREAVVDAEVRRVHPGRVELPPTVNKTGTRRSGRDGDLGGKLRPDLTAHPCDDRRHGLPLNAVVTASGAEPFKQALARLSAVPGHISGRKPHLS
jgi:hypothetical protein